MYINGCGRAVFTLKSVSVCGAESLAAAKELLLAIEILSDILPESPEY